MDAVDVAGFLEFDSIVLRDGLLESSEAVQRIVTEKWAFTEESVGKCRPRRSEEASRTGITVEGELVYLDVEQEEDLDVDVEGDETSSVPLPTADTRSRGVGHVDDGIKRTGVPEVTERKKPKSAYSRECSLGVDECGGSLPQVTSAGRINGADRSPRSDSCDGKGITGTPSPTVTDVRPVPEVAREEHSKPPKCEIHSDESDGVPHPKDSAIAVATGGSEVADSARGDTRTACTPTLTGAGASVPTGDNRVYLWKSAVGVCGICGKVFNNNSNLKRHAHVHGRGILLTCDVCGQFFPDRWSLWRHKEQHVGKSHSKMYKCSICGKCVNSSHSLRKHRAQHVQPYVCEVCGESFHRASGLQIHKYLHAR